MKVRKITCGDVANIKKLLRYEDGKVFWKEDRTPKIKAGDRAGTFTTSGYRTISVSQRKVYEHRAVWMLCHGSAPNMLDHINGNKVDNHIENLRELSSVGNSRAHRNQKKGVTSKYRGVHLNKVSKKFVAQISDGSSRKRWIGLFTCEVEAAKAYDKAAIKFGYLPEALNYPK
jgi:hypothetical protein